MRKSRPNRCRERHRFTTSACLELLEDRVLLSASPLIFPAQNHLAVPTAKHTFVIESSRKKHPTASSASGEGLTPAQMDAAYGINQITFGSVTGTGLGQTIAIVDAYDDPTAANDLQTFDAAFGLADLQPYSALGNTAPFFERVAQDGSTNYPPTDPAGAGNKDGTWEIEESLDIEWAHAIAPQANIILVEANDDTDTNLIQHAVNWARSQPGVSAISMSFSGSEFSSESSLDTYFTTPAGHTGVTFLAATGDDGEPSGYPAYSPNVVAVGGTTLTLNSNGSYAAETGWSDGGGGISKYEPQPAYQSGIVTQSATLRANPDVSMDADPNSGVAVFDSWDFGQSNGWLQVGGTSLATPMWAGLIAIANQLRAANGAAPLDGATQTLPRLYALPATDFHDITSGNNGFAAGPGYDLVTGRGSPIANLLIPALAGIGTVSGTVFQDNNGNGIEDGTDTPLAGVTVFIDANDNGVLDGPSSVTDSSTNVPIAIPDRNSTGITSSLPVSGLSPDLTDINITFNITHTYDSDLIATLIAPDGTKITLFSHIGGSGQNFTNTTLDDQASTSIASASAPFSGTYQPSSGKLAAFDGDNPNGTWKLNVADTVRRDTGTLNSWSLQITTAGEQYTVTDANGNYSFSNLPFGSTQIIRQILPANYIQDAPAGGAPLTVPITGNVTGANFADFPTLFTASGNTDSFYLRLDPTGTYLEIFNSATDQGTPDYQIALVALQGLTFDLDGAANTLILDFSNGSPIPIGNLNLVTAIPYSATLDILGQTPGQNFNMTDTQIGPTAGSSVLFQSLDSLSLATATINYSGSFSTLNNLTIASDATFNWN